MGSIHLFKITGMLTSKNVNLKRNKFNNGNGLEGSQCDFKQK